MAEYELHKIFPPHNLNTVKQSLNQGFIPGGIFEYGKEPINIYQIMYKLPSPVTIPQVANRLQTNDPSGLAGGNRYRRRITRKMKHKLTRKNAVSKRFPKGG